MLTTEALDDREWHGLRTLRAILGKNRREYENRLYPTSISDAEPDHYRRASLLAGVISANQGAVASWLSTITEPEPRSECAYAVVDEIDHLRAMLRTLAERLNSQERELAQVNKDILRSMSVPLHTETDER